MRMERHGLGRRLPAALLTCLVCLSPTSGTGPVVRALRADCSAAAMRSKRAVETVPQEGAGAARCVAYLEGLAHMLNLNCMLWHRGEIAGEVPAADVRGVPPEAFVRAFLAWAKKHPELADEDQ